MEVRACAGFDIDATAGYCFGQYDDPAGTFAQNLPNDADFTGLDNVCESSINACACASSPRHDCQRVMHGRHDGSHRSVRKMTGP